MLPPVRNGEINPPIGSEGFGTSGLKTMSVSMNTGDTLLVYTPSVTSMSSDSGKIWGLKGLVSSFRNSNSQKPEVIVADIIGDLKDFSGKDELENPLQLLVIRKR